MMNLLRKLTLVVATGTTALGAGHFVQKKAGDRAMAEPPEVVVSGVLPVAAGPADVVTHPITIAPPVLPAEAAPMEVAVSSSDDPPKEILAATAPVETGPRGLPPMPAPAMADTPDCTVKFDLLPQPDAMIGVSLLAPCQPGQRVVLKHAGLTITGRTSGSGALFTTLPALTAVADVEAVFPGGEKARGSLPMADMAGLQRFAVQWQDEDAFQLHAFENGAGYDQPGHISSVFSGISGETGLLAQLGDTSVDLPLLAEVYTFGPADRTEVVLEAVVTQGTCGREILGETIFARDGSVEIVDLTLAMPGCEAVGDILVLKNLLEDMTLATAN